jgi:phospholipase C
MPTQIEHLVVLMLENRSFDHMLGFMKRDNPAIDGLVGDEWSYPASELEPKVCVSEDAADAHDLTPDPHHDFEDVTRQIFSTNDPDDPADMRGFVRDYHLACGDPVHARNVMKCFTPETLPILSTLAREYAVCDRWFASVPGSTIPNRMFVHGASSEGSVNQDAIDAPFLLKTVFESMGADTPYDYRIYSSGASILLANKYLMQHQGKFFKYDNFKEDARRGNLPAYTFIEPAYDDDGQGIFANSQHPDFPVDRGEALISDVYYALTASRGWEKTLLLILYDEHGGIFDHVPPPRVVRLPASDGLPDVKHSPDPPFDFTRLGVRVPAVFVSPCIPPNTVLHDRIYEHSSVVATVRKLFCPGTQPLNWREAQAPTFEDVLVLAGDEVRTDVVKLPVPKPTVGMQIDADKRKASELAVLMARTMEYSMNKKGIPTPAKSDTLRGASAAVVSRYLLDARSRVEEAAQ